MKCSACKIIAHTSCIAIIMERSQMACKPTFRDVGVRQYREQTTTHHHWVHRRTEKGKCRQCGKVCIDGFYLSICIISIKYFICSVSIMLTSKFWEKKCSVIICKSNWEQVTEFKQSFNELKRNWNLFYHNSIYLRNKSNKLMKINSKMI